MIIPKTEENLRPKLLKDYIGQENVSKTLKMFIDAVNKRGKPSEHILFTAHRESEKQLWLILLPMN